MLIDVHSHAWDYALHFTEALRMQARAPRGLEQPPGVGALPAPDHEDCLHVPGEPDNALLPILRGLAGRVHH
mgnify:CR=1 FL=1